MKTVQWKTLSKKHNCYNPDRVEHMRLLYKGGYDIKDKADCFLTPMMGESDAAFEERVSVSAYVPLLPKFIDTYTSNLFSEDLFVHEAQDSSDATTLGGEVKNRDFYKIFASDCDGLGTSFHSFIKEVYRTAQIEEYGWFGQDLPKNIFAPVNLLEEELSGQDRNILYKINQLSVWDYHVGKDGKLDWIKLGCCIYDADSFDSSEMHHYEIKVFTRTPQGMIWQEWVTKSYESDQDPQPEDYFGSTDEGVSSYKCIPVYCLDFSHNMSIGFKLGPMATEHFQMRSYENSATARACLTIPMVKLGPSIPQPGGTINPAQMKGHRGDDPRGQFNAKGYLILGSEDDVKIVETEGSALKFIHLQNEDRVETMHEVVSQLHSSSKQTSSKTGRSATAMKESRYAMEVALSEHAGMIYDLSKLVYQDLASSRGDSIVPVVEGLCTETPEDAEILIKRFQIMSRSAIGSNLFDKKYRFKLANALMNKTSREEQVEIQSQINKTVDSGDPAKLYGPTFDAELQQQINAKAAPDDAKEPGQGDPSAKINSKGGSDMVGNNSPDNESEDDQMPMAHGHSLLPEGSHLQTGEHISATTVYNHLAQDYKPSDIAFVKTISWRGPVSVPLTSIDNSNMDNWAAAQDDQLDKVNEWAEKFANGEDVKPIVVVNNPSNDNKYQIVDGHHRYLGALKAGKPVPAYVGDVGMDNGPWDRLHAKQVDGTEASITSNQVSRQVKDSENAVNGKSK